MKLGKQFIKFGLVGVLNTGVQFIVFVVLYRLFHVPMILASGLGYLAGIANSYLINRVWTFQVAEKKQMGEFLKFFAVNLVAMAVNLGTLKLLVSQFGMLEELAQIFAIGSSLVINFAGNKWWTFRGNKEESAMSNSSLIQEDTGD